MARQREGGSEGGTEGRVGWTSLWVEKAPFLPRNRFSLAGAIFLRGARRQSARPSHSNRTESSLSIASLPSFFLRFLADVSFLFLIFCHYFLFCFPFSTFSVSLSLSQVSPVPHSKVVKGYAPFSWIPSVLFFFFFYRPIDRVRVGKMSLAIPVTSSWPFFFK